MKESILQKIVKQRRLDIAAEQDLPGGSMKYLERLYALGLAPQQIDFKARLLYSISQDGVAVLCEVKRASPSKGDISMNVVAPSQALLYTTGGVACISVLTEPTWFKGIL